MLLRLPVALLMLPMRPLLLPTAMRAVRSYCSFADFTRQEFEDLPPLMGALLLLLLLPPPSLSLLLLLVHLARIFSLFSHRLVLIFAVLQVLKAMRLSAFKCDHVTLLLSIPRSI